MLFFLSFPASRTTSAPSSHRQYQLIETWARCSWLGEERELL